MSVTVCKRCIKKKQNKTKRHSRRRSFQDCIKVFERAVAIPFACSVAILFISLSFGTLIEIVPPDLYLRHASGVEESSAIGLFFVAAAIMYTFCIRNEM